MRLEFKEIEQANSGSGLQDDFELFCRDFLLHLGYEIVEGPDRGADGKKDMIVEENLKGIGNQKRVRWLVSCKHYAHSGKGVSDLDEPNIRDRIDTYKCNGFMGIYSTLVNASLSNILSKNKDKYDSLIYDRRAIERELLKINKDYDLIARYFPNSFEQYYKHLEKVKNVQLEGNKDVHYVQDTESFRTVMTVSLLIEFEKLKEEVYHSDTHSPDKDILNAIRKYSKHATIDFSIEVYEFVEDAVYQLKTKGGKELIELIFSTLTMFLPVYRESSIELYKEAILLGVNISESIVYEVIRYSGDFYTLMYGVNILKFFYLRAKNRRFDDIEKKIFLKFQSFIDMTKEYPSVDSNLQEEMINVFIDDLKNSTLALPPFSKEIMARIYEKN